MKKLELEEIEVTLKELQDFANKQDYNTTTFINQKINNIMPKIKKELDRVSEDNIVINCPAMIIITSMEVDEAGNCGIDLLNTKLQELVLNNYKIIDFGCFANSDKMYIKYTS